MASALSGTTPNDVERAVGFVNVLFTTSFFKPWKKRFLRLTVYPTLATLTMHKSPTVPSLGLLTLTTTSTVRLLDHKGRTCLRIESDEAADHPDVWFVNPNTTDEIARWLDALRNAISTIQNSARTPNTSLPNNNGGGSSSSQELRSLQLYPTSESLGVHRDQRRGSDPNPTSPDSMLFPESVVNLSPDELAASPIGRNGAMQPSQSGSGQVANGANGPLQPGLGPGPRGNAVNAALQPPPPPRSLPPQVPPPCLPPNLDAPSPNLAKRGLPRSISTPHLDRNPAPPPRSVASTRPGQPPPVPPMSQRSAPAYPNPRRPPPLQPSPSPGVDESVDATDQVLASYGFSAMPSSYRPPWTADEPGGAQGGGSSASSPTTKLNSMPDIPTLPPRPPSPHGSTPSPKTRVREVGSGQAQQPANRFSGERGLNGASPRISGERGLMSGGRPGSPRSRAREIARSESPGSAPGSLDRAGLPLPSSSSTPSAASSGVMSGYSPMRRALPLHDNQPLSPQQSHFGRQVPNGNGNGSGSISAPPPPASNAGAAAAGSSPLRSFRSDSPPESQYTAMGSDLSFSVQHHPTSTHQHQHGYSRQQQSHSHASDPIGHTRTYCSHSTMPLSVRSTAATMLASPPLSRANSSDRLKPTPAGLGSSNGGGGESVPARNRSLYPQDQDVTRAQRLRERMNMVGTSSNNSPGGGPGSSISSSPNSSSMSLHSSPTPMGPSPASSNPSSPLAPHRDADRVQPQFPPPRQVPVHQQQFEHRQQASPGHSHHPRHDHHHPQQYPQPHSSRDQSRFDPHVQQYPRRQQHANHHRQHQSGVVAQRTPHQQYHQQPQAKVTEYVPKGH